MRRFSCSFITAGLGLACVVLAAPAAAAEGHPARDGTQIAAATQVAEASATPPRRTPGMTEIPDPELATMRGRYTVGDHQVAWFGVSMISTWQTASGQTLQGTLSLGMDFAGTGRPVISFTPTVTVTGAETPMPGNDGVVRSVDASGLANVSGMTQSVQVAGDRNVAANVTRLNVRDGSVPGASGAGSSGSSGSVSRSVGDATASAGFESGGAAVLLQVQGQGAVQQWIRNGSLGQSIQLTSDNQHVNNRMEIDLVRNPLAANAQLAQNVAQAIHMTRGIGPGGY